MRILLSVTHMQYGVHVRCMCIPVSSRAWRRGALTILPSFMADPCFRLKYLSHAITLTRTTCARHDTLQMVWSESASVP
jgi:hypothetical protein